MTFVLVNENKGDKINNTVNNKAEERRTFALFSAYHDSVYAVQ